MVYSTIIRLKTDGFADARDITPELVAAVKDSGVRQGIVCVVTAGSTGGITTIEFEPGAMADLRAALDRIAPQKGRYEHDATWGDGNGFAHLRSALIGTSCAFPVKDGKPALGTWQQVVFLDFDNRPRTRELTVTIVGE